MGVVSSRQFRQALRKGDENAALDLYHSLEDLKSLNPSKSYGLIHKITPLHYSAKRGFVRLFKEFLINGGDPNAENHKKQSVVHEICITTHGGDPSVAETRAEMLQFLIDFCTDPARVCPNPPKPLKPQLLNLNKQDSTFNTPLHLAATSGLLKCAELLVSHGAVIHFENIARQTPFDCAEVSHHEEIMAFLEPKMVFSLSKDSNVLKLKPDTLRQESYQGMQGQELQEIKDSLVLQMAGLLGVSLFNATALLQAFGWSRELLITAWLENSPAACEQAKIQQPLTQQASLTDGVVARQMSIEERECEICTEVVTTLTPIPCGHIFCKACWKEYLELKISEGKAAELECPSFGCNKLVPIDIITTIIPKEVDAKYLKFGIDAFVEAHSSLKWCPHPGCGRAVHLPESGAGNDDGASIASAESAGSSTVEVPRTVDCGMGHFFCWACAGDAHDPCNCDLWTQWKDEVLKHEESGSLIDSAVTAASQTASSDHWIAEHSKRCPNCKAPIEKTDGCNHMECSKCNHGFCWVCLGSWRIHGDRTGGYFDCNRYRAARNTEQRLTKAREVAEEAEKRRNTKYFKHAFTRYLNHTQSLKYEESLLGSAKEKAAALISAALVSSANISKDNIDDRFVEDAIRELLKARRVLRSSYAMSYFIPSDSARNRLIKLLAPLEKSTETLAEMIARPHLRTPKDKIILATLESREIRRRFLPEARKLNYKQLPSPNLGLEDESLDPVDLRGSDDSDGSDWDDDNNDEFDTSTGSDVS